MLFSEYDNVLLENKLGPFLKMRRNRAGTLDRIRKTEFGGPNK